MGYVLELYAFISPLQNLVLPVLADTRGVPLFIVLDFFWRSFKNAAKELERFTVSNNESCDLPNSFKDLASSILVSKVNMDLLV